MTKQDEYENFIKNTAQHLNIEPEAMEVILDMGRTLYYDRLADWAENDMKLFERPQWVKEVRGEKE